MGIVKSLTRNELLKVFRYDEKSGDIYNTQKGKIEFNPMRLKSGKNYKRVTYKGKLYLAHRVAYILYYGDIMDDSLVIDHVDGNGFNNSIKNLRLVSNSKNLRNFRRPNKNNSTGVHGVCKLGDKYVVRLGNKYIGIFANLELAKIARLESEKKYGWRK